MPQSYPQFVFKMIDSQIYPQFVFKMIDSRKNGCPFDDPCLTNKKTGEVFRGLRSCHYPANSERRAFSSLPVPFPSCFPKRSSMMAYGCCCFLVSSRVPHASSTSWITFSCKLLMSCIPKDPCMAYLHVQKNHPTVGKYASPLFPLGMYVRFLGIVRFHEAEQICFFASTPPCQRMFVFSRVASVTSDTLEMRHVKTTPSHSSLLVYPIGS